MIKVLMIKVGLKMGYIEKRSLGGEDSGGYYTPGYFFQLFRVLNVLHCLYNLKMSNLICVTSKALWQFINSCIYRIFKICSCK